MLLSTLFNKESALGVDIGSHQIKAVEIATNSGGWELVNAAVTPCPQGAVKDGVVVNNLEVSQAIRTMLRDAGVKTTGAVCGVSGSQVIVRQVQFPRMPEATLRKSIKYEASKHIASSMDDSIAEFEIVGDGEEPGQMSVWLVAAPREMIESRVRVMESVGLDPLAVDIEAFALIRALVEFSASDKYLHETVALVDMGASHTDVNVVSKGEFALTRNIPIAGDSFTNAIKSLTGGTYEEAEQMKLELTRACPLDRIGSEQPENKTWKVVQPLLDELIREIKRSINYYHSQFPEGNVESFVGKMILTGGSARIPGMDAFISSKLNIPAVIADVFRQSALGLEGPTADFAAEHSPVLTVGTGLALKELVLEAKQKAA